MNETQEPSFSTDNDTVTVGHRPMRDPVHNHDIRMLGLVRSFRVSRQVQDSPDLSLTQHRSHHLYQPRAHSSWMWTVALKGATCQYDSPHPLHPEVGACPQMRARCLHSSLSSSCTRCRMACFDVSCTSPARKNSSRIMYTLLKLNTRSSSHTLPKNWSSNSTKRWIDSK